MDALVTPVPVDAADDGSMFAALLVVAMHVWSDDQVTSLVHAIDHLEEEGLNPRRYHRDELARIAAGPARDALATEAFKLAGAQLSQGATDPQFARPQWCAPPARIDLDALLDAAIEHNTIEESLARLAPRHEGYVRLRNALAAYRKVTWNLVPPGRSLRVGDDDPRVLDIRKRLNAGGTSTRFDEELDALVRHFQEHHGIEVDGIVGPETLRELNVPASDRVRQIAANMERWRWMPDHLGDRALLVNIAAFRLDVLEGERTVLQMKTVVGKDYTRTPFFAARLTEVIVNPWWNVPDSIAAKELWPKQRRDPSYFAGEHMIVSNGRIRQRPGPWNALGRLKFNMPNHYDVYLHDTPAKSLFARSFRAFSHGCIRLERPLDLAHYLLPDIDFEAEIESGRERAIPLPSPLPVYVLYWTAWVGDDGHMEFHRDHYERDAALAASLLD